MQEEAEKLEQLRTALRALGFEQDTHYALRRAQAGWALRWLRPLTYAQLSQAERLLQTVLNGVAHPAPTKRGARPSTGKGK